MLMMKDKSTMGLGEYLFDCLFYMVISAVWYQNILFRCLPGRTYTESKIILFGMIGLSIVICAFLLNRHARTGWTVATALGIPFGLYTVLTYSRTVGVWMPIVLALSVALSIAFAIYLLTRRIRNRKRKSKVIKHRIYRSCIMCQSILTVALLVIMGSIGVHGVFGANILNSSVSATTIERCSSQTISNNIDTILLLQEEEWGELSTREKLDTLQTVANIEAHYLGLPNELNVGIANLKEDILASYNDNTHTISIDLDHLENDSVYEVLNSCCHEAYHSYQYRLVDAYSTADERIKRLRIYKSAAQYEQEFGNYIDGDYDFCSYYEQHCEMDARDYADDAVYDYYNRIRDYLNEASSEKG